MTALDKDQSQGLVSVCIIDITRDGLSHITKSQRYIRGHVCRKNLTSSFLMCLARDPERPLGPLQS